MKQKKSCPKCKSADIEITGDSTLSFIVCKSCGYDESLYEVTAGQRSTQREKGKYTPYKTGGAQRTSKKIE